MTAEEAFQVLQPYFSSPVIDLLEPYYIPPRRTVLFNHPFRMIAPEAIGVEDWYIPPYRRIAPADLSPEFWESPIGQALATLAKAHNLSIAKVEDAIIGAIEDEQTWKELLESLEIPLSY